VSPEPPSRTVVVSRPAGLHARPCLAIVNTVRRFQSKVQLRRDKETADADQILQLMALGAPQGTELVLTANGPDADEALDALERLFANDFGLGE
jgi:phosphotransferase system HPr (HPr) family protein